MTDKWVYDPSCQLFRHVIGDQIVATITRNWVWRLTHGRPGELGYVNIDDYQRDLALARALNSTLEATR